MFEVKEIEVKKAVILCRGLIASGFPFHRVPKGGLRTEFIGMLNVLAGIPCQNSLSSRLSHRVSDSQEPLMVAAAVDGARPDHLRRD